MPLYGRVKDLAAPSGEKRIRRAAVSLFIGSSAVPPPEGGAATATIGLYPPTFSSEEPSQTLYS